MTRAPRSPMLAVMDAPLCLVGMSGIGKSYWAKRLEAAGFTRHDCDSAIAAQLGELVTPAEGEEPVHALGRWMGMPWSEGYAAREARYLVLEAQVTREALDAATGALAAATDARHVIDTTGSVIYCDDALLADLRARTRVVYLRTPDERRAAVLRRYIQEPKPVVWGDAFRPRAGERPEDALPRCYEELLAIRDRRYHALAHVTLDGAELEAHDPGVEGFLRLVREE